MLRSALIVSMFVGLALASPVAGWSARPAQPAVASSVAPSVATGPTLDDATRATGEQLIAKAIEFLRSKQDAKTGGWSVPTDPTRPHLPAISGLVLNGLLLQPGLDASDPSVARAVAYILSHRKPDGGIYDTMLPSYNTAISLSALARVKTDQAQAAIKPAQDFLKRLQWGNDDPAGMNAPGQHGTETPVKVSESDPNFGGVGYGNRGRPDISNLAFAVQAWHDSGLPVDDPAYTRAIVFLQRVQMLERAPGAGASAKTVNTMPYAKGSTQGGFIYATGETADKPGIGHSFAGTIEETLSDGSRASRLRAYGSVTYSGFKSYLYAGLKRDDPRVLAAVDWARRSWSLSENPGLGTDGYWYYVVMMSRALDALGQDVLTIEAFEPLRTSVSVAGLPTSLRGRDGAPGLLKLLEPLGIKATGVTPSGADGALVHFASDEQAIEATAKIQGLKAEGATLSATRSPAPAPTAPGVRLNWRAELINQLASRQNPDGSFASVDDRWMENNPVLITAYALIALQHALRSPK
jgi:squalene-hopene/tetraprenyl-beta-curcumene cyclase